MARDSAPGTGAISPLTSSPRAQFPVLGQNVGKRHYLRFQKLAKSLSKSGVERYAKDGRLWTAFKTRGCEASAQSFFLGNPIFRCR